MKKFAKFVISETPRTRKEKFDKYIKTSRTEKFVMDDAPEKSRPGIEHEFGKFGGRTWHHKKTSR